LRALVGEHVAFLEGGAPVARQTRRLLAERGWLAQDPTHSVPSALPVFGTTGDANNMRLAVLRWLNVDTQVQTLRIHSALQPASSNP
jgi:glutamate racemase